MSGADALETTVLLRRRARRTNGDVTTADCLRVLVRVVQRVGGTEEGTHLVEGGLGLHLLLV